MPSRARLGALFTSIVGTTSLLAACSSDEPEGLSNDGFDFVCAGNQYEPLAGVSPGTPVDYMELRSESIRPRESGEEEPKPFSEHQTGVACATATDKEKCNATLEAIRSSEGWTTGGGGIETRREYLVFTRGDTVEKVTTLDALAKFVAPVDTPKDAALLVTAADAQRWVECKEGTAKKTSDGFEVIVRTGNSCGEIYEHRLSVTTDGTQTSLESALAYRAKQTCTIGRIPDGLVSSYAARKTLGDHFARTAHLEAASVVAFERLAEELAALGAPDDLVLAAKKSADDERRHAMTTERLARRFGGTTIAPEVEPVGKRSLFDIVLENALEGCVRESFGALVATYQAEHALDDEIREAMRTIAREETDHAWLSWELHAWAKTRLSPEEMDRIERARDEAAHAFAKSLVEDDVPEDVRRLAGHPPRAHAQQMFASLRAELFHS